MTTIRLDIQDGGPAITAEHTILPTGASRYRFDDDTIRGTLYVTHADGPVLAVQFADPHATDIHDTFVDIADWGLTGSVLCLPPHMNPIPHPAHTGRHYPLGPLDPDTHLLTTRLLRAVTTHHHNHSHSHSHSHDQDTHP